MKKRKLLIALAVVPLLTVGAALASCNNNPTPDPVDPVDPDKPDPDKPDPDKPEDLSKSQNLILKVNDNWEAIHKLELGE